MLYEVITIYFDKIVLDACQVTNPSIDPLREPMELRTYVGKKPEKLEFDYRITSYNVCYTKLLRCTTECSWGVYRRQGNKILTYPNRCGACLRCVSLCPRDAITVTLNQSCGREHPVWTPEVKQDVVTQRNNFV